MITVVKQACFQYNELDAKAQEKAFNEWFDIQNGSYPWASENSDALSMFVVEVGNYCRVGRGSRVIDTGGMEDDILNLKGKRACAWFFNNMGHVLFPAKRHYLPGSNYQKKRVSRILRTNQPEYSGYWLDHEICSPIYTLWTKAGYGYTVGDIIDQCADAWERAVEKDHDHYHSLEYFIEECENRGMTFKRDGSLLSEKY